MNNNLWNPDSLSLKEIGNMAVIEPLDTINQLDADTLFEKTDYIRRNLHFITTKKIRRYDIAGIIGLGKSTLPKIMQLYMDAKEFNEKTDNLILQLFYHDMLTYSFPFQFYLAEDREKLILNAKQADSSTIIDRSPYEDLIFSQLLQESGAMSLKQLELVKEIIKSKTKQTGHSDVLVWLQGKPEIAYDRIQKRGIKYEAEGSNRPLTNTENREIIKIRSSFLDLVKRYAPSEVKNYSAKHENAGIPDIIKAGGISLDYLKSLNKKYNDEFENILQTLDFNGVLVKINVDNVEGVDKRVNFNDHIAIMEKIMDASLLSLHRQGYKIEKNSKEDISKIYY